jgi:hypothetical protein
MVKGLKPFWLHVHWYLVENTSLGSSMINLHLKSPYLWALVGLCNPCSIPKIEYILDTKSVKLGTL